MRIFLLLIVLLSGGAQAAQLPWAASQPLSKLTGLVKPQGWQKMASWKSDFVVRAGELPASYDWRSVVGGLSPIRRQRCGDCWAQGSLGVLEAQVKINTKQIVPLSVQEVISCSGSGSCNGGYFAHDYHVSHGGALESAFPYSGSDRRCTHPEASYHLQNWGYVGEEGQMPSPEQIKAAILEHGPSAVTVYANNSMQRFRGPGVFEGCQNGGTNHIVMIVGWDDTVKTRNGQGVWLMRNSWGEDWGDAGYAKVPYGCSRIGEATTWTQFKK